MAALLLAPVQERVAIVESIERRMGELYTPEGAARAKAPASRLEPAMPSPGQREVRVVLPPRDKGGHVEQVIRTYEVRETKAAKATRKRKEA